MCTLFELFLSWVKILDVQCWYYQDSYHRIVETGYKKDAEKFAGAKWNTLKRSERQEKNGVWERRLRYEDAQDRTGSLCHWTMCHYCLSWSSLLSTKLQYQDSSKLRQYLESKFLIENGSENQTAYLGGPVAFWSAWIIGSPKNPEDFSPLKIFHLKPRIWPSWTFGVKLFHLGSEKTCLKITRLLPILLSASVQWHQVAIFL